MNYPELEILCEVLPSWSRTTVGKRCYVNAFKTKTIQIALKYRQFCSFKVVHAGIIFYRHSGMTAQFLVCFPITEREYDQANFQREVSRSFMFNLDRPEGFKLSNFPS